MLKELQAAHISLTQQAESMRKSNEGLKLQQERSVRGQHRSPSYCCRILIRLLRKCVDFGKFHSNFTLHLHCAVTRGSHTLNTFTSLDIMETVMINNVYTMINEAMIYFSEVL